MEMSIIMQFSYSNTCHNIMLLTSRPIISGSAVVTIVTPVCGE